MKFYSCDVVPQSSTSTTVCAHKIRNAIVNRRRLVYNTDGSSQGPFTSLRLDELNWHFTVLNIYTSSSVQFSHGDAHATMTFFF